MVKAAKIAYKEYPTVVNEVPESGLIYNNTMTDYAKMDSAMQGAQKAIGGSSDSAQLSQSYYWTKIANGEIDDDCKQLYENTVILAVCAQLAIDGCKREYSVDVNNDIQRIRQQPCMNRKKDYPKFMKWTHKIAYTKNGKERPQPEIKKDKDKVQRRIDDKLICPMNWLQDALDKIQGADKKHTIDTSDFFIYQSGPANNRQMSKIRKITEEYDAYTKRIMILLKDDPDSSDYIELLKIKTDEILSELKRKKISFITMNRLISSVLGIDTGIRNDRKYNNASKYTRKILTLLYRCDKEKFLKCFKKSE